MEQHGKTRWLLLALFFTGLWLAGPLFAEWTPLAEDGLHDPDNPALEVMQNPGDALSLLPRDDAGDVGNKVRWVQALEQGYIEPRTNIFPETKIEVLDLDIIMKNTGSTAMYAFRTSPIPSGLTAATAMTRSSSEGR